MNEENRIIFFKRSTFRVAEVIFTFPNRTFHLRELAEETGKIAEQEPLSTTAVSASIELLKKQEIIQVTDTAATKNIRADLESRAYYDYKRIFNLYRLTRWEVSGFLQRRFAPQAVVVFGSFAKGEDAENSDIDLLVVGSSDQDDHNITDWLKILEKSFHRKINLQFISTLAQATPEFRSAVANGIVLAGTLDLGL